jgi:hypothetical protein
MPKTGERTREIQWDGKTITVPGIYVGLPIERYHAGDLCDGPSISSSGLRSIWGKDTCPAYYWNESPYNPDREEVPTSEAFIMGRAVHHLFMGEYGDYKNLFVVRPDKVDGKPWQGNRTECRAWTEEQAKAGRAVLKGEQIEQIKGMALALGNDPAVRQGVLNGRIERSYIWKDKETGVWVKWRPDTTPNESLDFNDLKTTESVLDGKVEKSLADFQYHRQGALGRWACRELLGAQMATFSLLFVEKKKPHCIRFMSVKDIALDKGELENRHALRLFWKCLKTKTWPGPRHSDFEYIDLSDREHERIEKQLNYDKGDVK